MPRAARKRPFSSSCTPARRPARPAIYAGHRQPPTAGGVPAAAERRPTHETHNDTPPHQQRHPQKRSTCSRPPRCSRTPSGGASRATRSRCCCSTSRRRCRRRSGSSRSSSSSRPAAATRCALVLWTVCGLDCVWTGRGWVAARLWRGRERPRPPTTHQQIHQSTSRHHNNTYIHT